MNDTEHRACFGFTEVRRNDKPGLVRQVFRNVAPNYDIMNDLMSAGIHRLWKTALIDWLAPRSRHDILDLAGGTGDLAFRCLDRCQDLTMTVLDASEAMVAEGYRRASKRDETAKIDWIVGDATAMPLRDDRFDACMVGFGLRNFADPMVALAEIRRVLKTGGRLMILEFSRVENAFLRELYDLYSFAAIPRLGAAVAGDADSYRYLVESIRKFPDQETLAGMMRRVGFARVGYRTYHFGVAAIHSGWKL